MRELIAKGGAGGGVIFETDDCVLRDPFGNPLRFTERPAT